MLLPIYRAELLHTIPLLAAAGVGLAVSVEHSLLLHAAVRWSARGRGTTLELLAGCKQLLCVFLAVHNTLQLAASAVRLAVSVESRRFRACWAWNALFCQ